MINKISHYSKYIVLSALVYLGMIVSYPNNNSSRITMNPYHQILLLLILSIFSFILWKIKYFRIKKLTVVINIIFSLIYSVLIVLGRAYVSTGNLSLLWSRPKDYFYTVISWLATAIMCYYSIIFIIWLFSHYCDSNEKRVQREELKKFIVVISTLIIVLWLPYFLINLPGNITYDGMDQLNELFRSKVVNGRFVFTNHHPVFITLFEGSLFKLGITFFHSSNAGVLLNTIVLNLLSIGSFTYLSTVIAYYFSQRAAYWLSLFFGIFPVFPLWAQALDKTGYFTAIFAAFIATIVILDQNTNHSWKIYILLFILSLLLGLVRNDGFVYVFMAMIGSLTLHQKEKVGLLLLLSLTSIGLSSKALMKASHALPTEPMESLAVPIQQIYRSVKYNPQSINKDEKRNLNKFFRYSNIKNNYDPEFADVSKFNSRWPYYQFKGDYQHNLKLYEQQEFVRNKKGFFQIYKQLGRKNKKIYLEALVAQNIYYVYPQNHDSHYGWAIYSNSGNIQNTKLFEHYSNWFPLISRQGIKLLVVISKLPIIGLLFITFTWFFMWVIISFVMIDQRRFYYLNLIFIGVAIICVALLSPLNGFSRYYQPLMVLDPILLVIVMNKFEDSKKGSEK